MKKVLELIKIRAAYQRSLDNLDYEDAARKYPLQAGFRSGYGYACHIQSVIHKYDKLIEEELC